MQFVNAVENVLLDVLLILSFAIMQERFAMELSFKYF